MDKCQQQDSNLRPFAYETSALPLSYADFIFVPKLYYNDTIVSSWGRSPKDLITNYNLA